MHLDAENLPRYAQGCAVLGSGGGGDVYAMVLGALQAIEEHGPVEVVDLDDLPDDALIMPCGGVGAPTVSLEKVGGATEGVSLRAAAEAALGVPVAAIMASEIGGGNGVLPAAWAALCDLPLVDADGMGRAFPEIPQVTMELAGISPTPAVMVDERGNAVVTRPIDGAWAERLARTLAVQFGGAMSAADYFMTAEQARTATVRGSVSLGLAIGEALAQPDPLEQLVALVDGRTLVAGKIVEVERRTEGGFARGSVVIAGLGADSGRLLRLEIQNENLVAMEDGRVRASAPDLITVLDSTTAEAVPTERLAYGQRVTVVSFACDPVWRTPAGLALAGPQSFGYDFDFVPVEDL